MLTKAVVTESSRSVACPGDTVSYVCSADDVESVFIIWRISCHASTSELSCQSNVESLDISAGTSESTSVCEPTYDDVLGMYDFIDGVSNLNITLPQPTMIRHLGVECGSDCRQLTVAGKISSN